MALVATVAASAPRAAAAQTWPDAPLVVELGGAGRLVVGGEASVVAGERWRPGILARMVRVDARAIALSLCLTAAALPAFAQAAPEPPPPSVAPAPPSAPPAPPDDTALVIAEPDFTLIAMPTTLRLPDGKWAFRVAHRFTRALTQGSFGDLASDLFGLDGSAIVGLELRYGVRPGTQLVLLRTSDRTIQLMTQQSVVSAGTHAIGVDVIAAVQGLDNFSERYTSTVGALLSRRFGSRGAAYLQPLIVINPLPETDTADDVTVITAVGGRVRFGASTYLVGEAAPRLSGASPGDHHVAFALEKRRGGHSFQISVANSFATTLGQVARGYGGSGEWHLGFTISRKFYRASQPPPGANAPAR